MGGYSAIFTHFHAISRIPTHFLRFSPFSANSIISMNLDEISLISIDLHTNPWHTGNCTKRMYMFRAIPDVTAALWPPFWRICSLFVSFSCHFSEFRAFSRNFSHCSDFHILMNIHAISSICIDFHTTPWHTENCTKRIYIVHLTLSLP